MVFKHPFTAVIAGPTGCGKTQLTLKLIDNCKSIITPQPQNVMWCYGIYQSAFNGQKNIYFNQGLPDIKTFDPNIRNLLIIDDLMHEADESVAQIFTKGSHHYNISVIFLTQNLFFGSKHMRTMSLNTHYMLLFKNPRDASQINCLARQMYPKNSKFLIDAFKDATEPPYGYLLIDLKPDTPEKLRVRSNIFPGEKTYVYVPK